MDEIAKELRQDIIDAIERAVKTGGEKGYSSLGTITMIGDVLLMASGAHVEAVKDIYGRTKN